MTLPSPASSVPQIRIAQSDVTLLNSELAPPTLAHPPLIRQRLLGVLSQLAAAGDQGRQAGLRAEKHVGKEFDVQVKDIDEGRSRSGP
jgi:hypothetical protein